jgi:hypothetical protein
VMAEAEETARIELPARARKLRSVDFGFMVWKTRDDGCGKETMRLRTC